MDTTTITALDRAFDHLLEAGVSPPSARRRGGEWHDVLSQPYRARYPTGDPPMRVIRRETEADRLRSIESDVAMLKRRMTASPLPEEQRSLVREAIVKQSWPFRSVVITLGVIGAAGGELVAGGAPGAALGAAAGLALPVIFEESLVTRLSRRRERKVRAKMESAGNDPSAIS